jgi:hypothetical protein
MAPGLHLRRQHLHATQSVLLGAAFARWGPFGGIIFVLPMPGHCQQDFS